MKIFERELFICGNFDACVEREIMDYAWSNSFLFLEKKNFNVSRSMFRIYFRKFVVYNGYKCYDDRKINSRRVALFEYIAS